MTREEWRLSKDFDEISREMNGNAFKYRSELKTDLGGFLSVSPQAAITDDRPRAEL